MQVMLRLRNHGVVLLYSFNCRIIFYSLFYWPSHNVHLSEFLKRLICAHRSVFLPFTFYPVASCLLPWFPFLLISTALAPFQDKLTWPFPDALSVLIIPFSWKYLAPWPQDSAAPFQSPGLASHPTLSSLQSSRHCARHQGVRVNSSKPQPWDPLVYKWRQAHPPVVQREAYSVCRVCWVIRYLINCSMKDFKGL